MSAIPRPGIPSDAEVSFLICNIHDTLLYVSVQMQKKYLTCKLLLESTLRNEKESFRPPCLLPPEDHALGYKEAEELPSLLPRIFLLIISSRTSPLETG